MKIKSQNSGMSLLEILVAIGLFAALSIMVTQAVFLTLRGLQKSEGSLKVRENLNYALAIMERQLRGAQNISECPNLDSRRIDYLSQEGAAASFSCLDIGASGYIASGSARLTSTEVAITGCSISCSSEEQAPFVTISLQAENSQSQEILKGKSSLQTKIYLRNF